MMTLNKQNSEIEGVQVLGTSENLLEITRDQHITDIIVAISGEMQGGMFQALLDAQEAAWKSSACRKFMKSCWAGCRSACSRPTGSCAHLWTKPG